MRRYATLIAATAAVAAVAAPPAALYVDCDSGSDSNSGLSPTSPLLTPQRARDIIRPLQPLPASLTVNVAGDCYPANWSTPVLTLESVDGGNATAGVTIAYVADATRGARMISGAPLNASAWYIVNASMPTVYATNVSSLAPWGFGSLGAGGLGQCTNDAAELFFNGSAATLARYPNVDPTTGYPRFLYITRVLGPLAFYLNDTRPLRWAGAPAAWLHGYWSFDWADSWVRIASIVAAGDGVGVNITIDPSTPPVYGFLDGAKFYAANILAELDATNEYYLGPDATLYYAAPGPFQMYEAFLSMAPYTVVMGNAPGSRASALTTVSATGEGRVMSPLELMQRPQAARMADTPAIEAVTLSGFGVHFSRTTGVYVSGGVSVSLSSLDVSNHGHSGVVLSGASCTLQDSVGSGMGCSASTVMGGDEQSLVAGNMVARNNSFTAYARVCRTYQPGISWSGVGNTYADNTIAQAPHTGVLGTGNSCIFSGNLLADLCYEVSDSGAWYSGRSWVRRGNRVVGNTFRNIRNVLGVALGYPSVQAVYLDDELSGTVVANNSFINCQKGAFVGGGRDTAVTGNTCIGSDLCVHIDNRGMNWQADSCAYNASYTGQLVADLFAVNYTLPPYATAYPEIVTTLSRRPCVPVNITVSGNTYCNATQGFIDVAANETASWDDVVVNNTPFTC